jgi:hypothetical protein
MTGGVDDPTVDPLAGFPFSYVPTYGFPRSFGGPKPPIRAGGPRTGRRPPFPMPGRAPLH